MAKVLYVNHRQQQCGVFEFGSGIANALIDSIQHEFSYCECDSFEELKTNYNNIHPDVIIYNYHPTTMPWIRSGRFNLPVTFMLRAIHIGTIHEVYQQLADDVTDEIFDFHIGPDPTMNLINPIVFKTGRLLPIIPDMKSARRVDKIPIIGSFGFATGGKGFDKIVKLVQQEFDEAVIKLNISFAKFGDETGENARKIAQECRALLYKKSIQLIIDHRYLEKHDLLHFLSSNSINVFLYDNMEERGISSATDWALASGRPLAISRSRLFRHLYNCRPSVCVEDSSLQSILENGTESLEFLYRLWSPESILAEYEKIVSTVLTRKSKSRSGKRRPIFFYLTRS